MNGSKMKLHVTSIHNMEANQMENKENLEQLLREYGYPSREIKRFIQDAKKLELDYSELQKRIMPYQDITSRRL